MAYQAPKWTQLTTPSSATSVNALTSAGDLFSKAIDKAQDTLTSYDEGVESRLQEDSDVNTAALRRRLESATDLDSLNAMQGDISATGLKGYGKRIDADALSQSFTKERGVMRDNFEQNFRENISQKLANATTPEEVAAVQAEVTNANAKNSWLDTSGQISAVSAADKVAKELQTKQQVTQFGIDLSGKSVKDLQDQRALIDSKMPGAKSKLDSIDRVINETILLESNQFSESIALEIAAAETPEQEAAILARVTKQQETNPEQDLTGVINATSELRTKLQTEDDRIAINTLTATVAQETDTTKLQTQLDKLNETPDVDNYTARRKVIMDRIAVVKGINETKSTNTLIKNIKGKSYDDLTAEINTLSEGGGQFQEKINIIRLQQSNIIEEEQKQYDIDTEIDLRAAAEDGIVSLQTAVNKLKTEGVKTSDGKLINAASIDQIEAEVRGIAAENSKNNATSRALGEQQKLFNNNDSYVKQAIVDIPNAAQYTSVDNNGQPIFSADMPADLKKLVQDRANSLGYTAPPKGILNQEEYISNLIENDGLSRDVAVQVTKDIDTSMYNAFNMSTAGKEKLAEKTAIVDGNLKEDIRLADVVYEKSTTLSGFNNTTIADIVGDPDEDINGWLRKHVDNEKWYYPSEGKDYTEINAQVQDIIENGVDGTKPEDIPANVIKLVISRRLTARNGDQLAYVNMNTGDLKDLVKSALTEVDELTRLDKHIKVYKDWREKTSKLKAAASQQIMIDSTDIAIRFGNTRRSDVFKGGSTN